MTERMAEGRGVTTLEKGLAAIVVGLVAAVVVIISLEPALQKINPVLELNPFEAEQRAAESLPRTALLLLLGVYAAASFIGGIASSLTSGRTQSWPALITGLVLMIAGTYGVMVVYQPLWFRLSSFLTYPMVYAGHLVVRRSS